MLRCLPLVLAATASVVLLPVLLVAAAIPRGGALSTAASVAATIAASITIAGLESAVWTRLCRSGDIAFSELMLWGWLRRCQTERRFAQGRDLDHAARKLSPTVRIEQLQRLSMMLEARDAYTHGHSRRVARHAARIARRMRLQEEEVAKIRTAAAVHDVGKIYTPKEIINNPGRLTDAEFEIVKRHAADGAKMLATVGSPEIAAMVRHHHERIDGRGYPDGLAGEEIPIGARIIAVADTFDALTSSRTYRNASTHRAALRLLARQGGSQLDREAVAAFLSMYSSRRSIGGLSLAAMLPRRILAALQAGSAGLNGLGASVSTATSLLPALGASGLLALASGAAHHSQGAVRPAGHRSTAVAEAQTTEDQAASGPQSAGSRSKDRSPRRHVHARRPAGLSTEGTKQEAQAQGPSIGGGETGTGESSSTQAPAPSSASASSHASDSPPDVPGEPATGAGEQPPSVGQPGPGESAPSSDAPPGLVSGTTEALTGVTTSALSGVTETLSSTTEALSSTTEALSSTTEALSSTTEALSGTKPLTEAVKSLLVETTGVLTKGATELIGGGEQALEPRVTGLEHTTSSQ